ncbi:MAG TPA: tRNA pseudouridine(13) synthase TruD [Gammaproteobacteria bacterium]|nr:tRNA pseudouridine(13) synthase TruD [Gammaproteobacteria bacterium]
MTHIPRWAHAHGPVTASARIRSTPEDFHVEEILGFEADGEGEHLLLKVEKRGANTLWVARELARYAGVSSRDVSYAGMKDRNAVTVQHFSLWLGKHAQPDWSTHSDQEFRILDIARHRRKLRIGSLKGNHFQIVLRDLSVPANELISKLESIRERGVPNYFGSQRFGRDGANIAQVEALFSGQLSLRDRKLRGLLLSTARSLLFNAVLSRRVQEHSWDRALAGEICMLEGSHSVFHAESVDDALIARAQTGDLHPTGPLWGKGESRVSGEVAALESSVVRDYAGFAQGLENAGLEQARRALRLPLKDLVWTTDTAQSLVLEFFLPAGAYATAVLRELVNTEDLQGEYRGAISD